MLQVYKVALGWLPTSPSVAGLWRVPECCVLHQQYQEVEGGGIVLFGIPYLGTSVAEMMILAVASVPFRLQVSFVARVMSQLAM